MKTDLLIVGGDGDLALRKLYPSLYFLVLNNVMPADTQIFGMARTEQSQEEFLAKVKQWMQDNVPDELFSEEKWSNFSSKLTFVQGDATNQASLNEAKNTFATGDQLVVYLAIPPRIFGTVCQTLDDCGLAGKNTRIVVEKPLGESRETFVEINKELTTTFDESQIFRIDHYLGKETVQNLIALRFANDILEPLWNSNHIDHIEITVAETVGVGNRWDFYNDTGATRDMVQNHLLQVLCLTCMEPPAVLDAESVRLEKLKVLNCLRMIEEDEVMDYTVRGQYQEGSVGGKKVPGYTNEDSDKYEVDASSKTETYVAIKAEIDNLRWSGVPIYLRTGKRLSNRYSEIVVKFKQKRHKVFDQNHIEHKANRLVIRLQPDAGIRLRINNKVAGLDAGMPIESGCLDMFFSDEEALKKADAYARLLFDVLRNNQTLFVSAAEAEAAWKWIDQIFAGWKANDWPLSYYPAGSAGPKEADELLSKDGFHWHNIDPSQDD